MKGLITCCGSAFYNCWEGVVCMTFTKHSHTQIAKHTHTHISICTRNDHYDSIGKERNENVLWWG